MPQVVILTDDGCEVARKTVEKGWLGSTLGRELMGQWVTPLGWLGRAIDDAHVIERGGDPERQSEKVMRLLAERREGARKKTAVSESAGPKKVP